MRMFYVISVEWKDPDYREVTEDPIMPVLSTVKMGRSMTAWRAGTVEIEKDTTRFEVFGLIADKLVEAIKPYGYTREHLRVISFDVQPDEIKAV